jgi:hypothetical protein
MYLCYNKYNPFDSTVEVIVGKSKADQNDIKPPLSTSPAKVNSTPPVGKRTSPPLVMPKTSDYPGTIRGD